MTSMTAAIKNWEAANEAVAEEAEYIKLYCQMPPINKIDASVANLKNCERLALSTNNIDRIGSLAGMGKLKILSLGRNLIKKIEKLEDVAATLEELWISYNQINSLDGLAGCTNLTTLYISNNQIKAWNELDKLAGLANLKDVLFVGNPIYDEMPKEQARIEVLKRLPQVSKIDGDMVKPTERELATGVHDG
mmetsp:Transcript_21295/g.35661  ORF Transcript_21295/g.35661 Transcript_21295/m.35661 type:complete len:192 (+) Transcript_21295:107-682(+)|eukprot:CAMPEP_0174963110 /NCGR_PEP_ID=MMETSP0004_2-20121128/5140_1 /TAXON_ID=420556 /ORGANISM="Ochromonas sp., Strain CCMP1393" /LENGTH=191 /DNA_ID=CAMNT_0016211683 /DNA_START=104 /DNA_END=679 /DNA_ORIENTATION=+